MELQREYLVDSDVVTFVTDIGDIKVYSTENADSEDVTFYFVKKNKVLKQLYVEADCAQNSGYLSSARFSEVN